MPCRTAGAGTPADGSSDSHLVLPIFFLFSYSFLEFPLGAPGTMVFMQRSAFQMNRIEQSRSRGDGPALTLIHGTCESDTTTSRRTAPLAATRSHQGFEGFKPDDTIPVTPGSVVQVSEPESQSSSSASRGNATPDNESAAHSGSGPILSSWQFAELAARYLEATAGDPVDRHAVSDAGRHSDGADIASIRSNVVSIRSGVMSIR